MKLLIASLALCALLTPSRAVPLNGTVAKHTGLCGYMRQHRHNMPGATIPQCDSQGNFLPQQCSGSTGYCWCVDIITGEEIPNTRTPPGSVPYDCNAEIYCPYGWSRFGKRCFIFIDSPKMWFEAENYCLFEGANLASICSYEENHFVQDLTRGSTHDFPEAWVGGHDAIQPCFWMWSDGSKFKYSDWQMDCEMDKKRAEHCVKINDGYQWKWNYAACNETLPFVCARRI